jgi:predicted transcriptional regulator
MRIELPDDVDYQALATAAGFASLEDYVIRLLHREAERRAIQEGINDANAGRMRPWAEVDAELRREFGFAPPA